MERKLNEIYLPIYKTQIIVNIAQWSRKKYTPHPLPQFHCDGYKILNEMKYSGHQEYEEHGTKRLLAHCMLIYN